MNDLPHIRRDTGCLVSLNRDTHDRLACLATFLAGTGSARRMFTNRFVEES